MAAKESAESILKWPQMAWKDPRTRYMGIAILVLALISIVAISIGKSILSLPATLSLSHGRSLSLSSL